MLHMLPSSQVVLLLGLVSAGAQAGQPEQLYGQVLYLLQSVAGAVNLIRGHSTSMSSDGTKSSSRGVGGGLPVDAAAMQLRLWEQLGRKLQPLQEPLAATREDLPGLDAGSGLAAPLWFQGSHRSNAAKNTAAVFAEVLQQGLQSLQQLGECIAQRSGGDTAAAVASADSSVVLSSLVQRVGETWSALYAWALGFKAATAAKGRSTALHALPTGVSCPRGITGCNASSMSVPQSTPSGGSYSELLSLLQMPQQMVELWGRQNGEEPGRNALDVPGEEACNQRLRIKRSVVCMRAC